MNTKINEPHGYEISFTRDGDLLCKVTISMGAFEPLDVTAATGCDQSLRSIFMAAAHVAGNVESSWRFPTREWKSEAQKKAS